MSLRAASSSKNASLNRMRRLPSPAALRQADFRTIYYTKKLAEILFFPESFLPPAEKRPGMTFHKTVVPDRKMWYNDLTIDRQGQTRF